MNSDEDNMNTAAISNSSGQFSAAKHVSYQNQLSSSEEGRNVSAYVFGNSSQEGDCGLLAMDGIKRNSDWQVSLAEVCTDGNGNFPEKPSDVIMLLSCSADRYPNANPFSVSLSDCSVFNDVSEHLSSSQLGVSLRQKVKDKYEIYDNCKKNSASMGQCDKENMDPKMEYSSWTVTLDPKMGKTDTLPVLELLSSTMSFKKNACSCNNTLDSCICTPSSTPDVANRVQSFDKASLDTEDKDCISPKYHKWPLVHVNIESSYGIPSSLKESQLLPSSVDQDPIQAVSDRWQLPSSSAETLFINDLSSSISNYFSEDCNHSYISSREANESFDYDVDVEDSLHKFENKDHDYMFDFPENPNLSNRTDVIDTEDLHINTKQNLSYQLLEEGENSSFVMNVSRFDFRNPYFCDNLSASCKEMDCLSSAIQESNTSLARTSNFLEDNTLFQRLQDYDPNNEPIHMTLEEVKTSLQQLAQGASYHKTEANVSTKDCLRSTGKRNTFNIHLRQKKTREINEVDQAKGSQHRKSFPSSIKQTFCSLFGGKKNPDIEEVYHSHSKSNEELSCSDLTLNLLSTPSQSIPSLSPFANRALPPLPPTEDSLDHHLVEKDSSIDEHEMHNFHQSESMDFTTSIHKVKDYGWYWGPISGETAEKILANEPDGSFIVRDSSDEHYIFSLTFKLNGMVRHVRIEHDQGNFSFGTFTNFKSQTIVGFIENAVEHSRSGRYLFFLHRRPVLGPMRVQLLHPVSRFKQIQSLQHMCRFVILKAVRRDLIDNLPLPKRLKYYLNTPQYYTEELETSAADLTPDHDLVHGNLELR